MANTIIYLTGKDTYRREHNFIKHCKKSDVATLLENRDRATVILYKNSVKKYDKLLQLAGFFMANVRDYSSDEYIIEYKRFA